MGTRHLIAVFDGGEYRLAQYGQWDGYPEGQGLTCLKFLRDEMDEWRFRTRLSRFSFIDGNDVVARRIDKAFEKGIGADVFPEFSRDTGAEILSMIQDGTATTRYLGNSISFAADSLFCEWAYVIDFDHNTFEVYRGYNREPLTAEEDRFFFLTDTATVSGDGYYPVKLAAMFDLDNLPTDEEFLDVFKSDDEED